MLSSVGAAPGSNGRIGIQNNAQNLWGRGRTPTCAPLASCIFHNLQHPLTAILAYSEMLAGDDLNGLQRAGFHKEIRVAVTRMNDLLSLVMEVSRVRSVPRSEPADIVNTIQCAIQAVAVRPEFRRISV